MKKLCMSAGSLFVLGLLNCGGKPTPVVAPPPTATAAAVTAQPQQIATAPDEMGGAPSDLSPVPAPGEVVGTLRWKNPGASLAALASFAKIPQSFIDQNLRGGIKEMMHDEMGELVDPAAMAEVVATDAPVEVLLVVDTKGTQPQLLVGWAIGLNSLRGALSAIKTKKTPVGAGLWQVGTDQQWGQRCVVAASSGRSPARLVCSKRYEHAIKLAPYMARTMPTAVESPADLVFDAEFKGVTKRYGQSWAQQAHSLPMLADAAKMGVKTFDTALADAAAAVADEAGPLLGDLDSIGLSLAIDPQKGATLAGKLQFAGKKSWLVSALIDGASLAGVAPEIFWRLPKASELVSWGRSGDPARFTKMMTILQGMAEGGLEKIKFAGDADRKAVAKLLRFPFGKYAASVGASGHFPAAAPGAKKAGLVDELFGSTMGWTLMGVEESPAALNGYLKDLVATYNRPGVQAALKKALGNDAKNLPVVKTMPAPASLGAGALDIEIKIPNLEDPSVSVNVGAPAAPAGPGAHPKPGPVAAPKATTSLTFHVMLMGDGNRTWVGFATDRDGLAKVLASTKGAAPGPDSLQNGTGLEIFRRGTHSSGGMITLQTFINAIKPAFNAALTMRGSGTPAAVQQILAMFEQLPFKGQTPMIMVGDVTDSAQPSTTFELNVPHQSLEDIGYIVSQAMALVQQQGARSSAP